MINLYSTGVGNHKHEWCTQYDLLVKRKADECSEQRTPACYRGNVTSTVLWWKVGRFLRKLQVEGYLDPFITFSNFMWQSQFHFSERTLVYTILVWITLLFTMPICSMEINLYSYNSWKDKEISHKKNGFSLLTATWMQLDDESFV